MVEHIVFKVWTAIMVFCGVSYVQIALTLGWWKVSDWWTGRPDRFKEAEERQTARIIAQGEAMERQKAELRKRIAASPDE